jgi:hypothetical protein
MWCSGQTWQLLQILAVLVLPHSSQRLNMKKDMLMGQVVMVNGLASSAGSK